MSKRSCEAAGSVEDALLRMARVNFHNAQAKVPQLRKKLDTLPQPDYHKQWNGESMRNTFLFVVSKFYIIARGAIAETEYPPGFLTLIT